MIAADPPPRDPEIAETPAQPLARGVAVIAGYVRTAPGGPGVYRMIGRRGNVLYVGKAKSIRKRIAAYASVPRLSTRIARMVADTTAMEFVLTHTEAEALLLEANLIKRFAPPYNILLRDDKSFPSILLTAGHPFPQVLKHRGARSRKGDYFGPFASAWAVNETLTVLERAFLLRSCTDTVFESRTRPCLLYQIKRCSAPCVGRIAEAEYARLVAEAREFLTGGSSRIQRDLAERMERASAAQNYEAAAELRDRIGALTRIQAHQDVNLRGADSLDVIAAHQAGGHTCVQVFFFRAGRNYGNRAFFPAHAREEEAPAVLEAFLGQFYQSNPPPPEVLLSHPLPNRALLAEALAVAAGRRVRLAVPVRGARRNLVVQAEANAREALARRLAESTAQRRLLEGLATALSLEAAPRRIEVYDNSHIAGREAVGAMIVAGPEGFDKKSYRKFTIRGAKPPAGSEGAGGERVGMSEAGEGFAAGDDYAMMREVLTRRFGRALREDPERHGEGWPDLVLIDGGLGQLNAVCAVLADLGVSRVAVAAIAKGPDRHAGRERIFLPGRPPIALAPRDPVLYFLQRLRDEAHRFAIGAHRAKRSNTLARSQLDDIPGIGARRKRALLHHFGSAAAVREAGRSDLAAVEGISRSIANRIYDWFHPEH